MKNKKKKIPEIIFPIFGIGFIFLSVEIVSFLDLPASFFCPEYTERVRPGLCAVPFLGKIIAGFSSLSFWLGLIIYGIMAGGSLFILHKKGYKI